MTWATGLGPRHTRTRFFTWTPGTNGSGRFHPGIVPYGPWVKANAEGQGPWDHDWANKSAYPVIDQWPGAERWFDNRCSPLNSEFTIHQTIAPVRRHVRHPLRPEEAMICVERGCVFKRA